MADRVRYRMEKMTDEFDELERRGLFTRPEIKEIVRRRRDFEERLQRPSPLKQDYLAYINYAQQVDRLRDLRKKKIRRREAKKWEELKIRQEGKKWDKSVSDNAGMKLILHIYRKAVVRYKGDLNLWFRYFEFCRERNHGEMNKVLPKAIRFHPKVPGLWIYAAAWEFDHNLNVAAARALMQRGLRACPKSEDLWIEYVRMELTYLNKLKARKVALGEDIRRPERGSGDAEQWKQENKDLFMALDEERDDAEGLDAQEGALEKRESLFWLQGSVILQTIYHGAVKALPSSMSLRKQFLEILDTVDLAHSDKLKEEILEDLKKNFSHDEHYWDWMARLQIIDAKKSGNMVKIEVQDKLNKAIKVYEEALDTLPSAKMFSLYAKFWLDMIDPERENLNSLPSDIAINALEISSSILKVYKKADSCGCLTEDLAYQYISFYLQMGRLEEARTLAEKLCEGKLSEAPKLWILRVSMEMKWLANRSFSMTKDDLSYAFKLFINGLTRFSILEVEDLWLMAMKFFSNNKEYSEKLAESLMTTLTKAGRSYSGCAVSSAVVNWVLQRDGIQKAREMYKRILDLPHPSLGIFRHCIELESNLALAGDSDGAGNARKLYESAISCYGQNRELWRDYYAMEMKIGTSDTVNAVSWRARKILKDTCGLSVPGNW